MIIDLHTYLWHTPEQLGPHFCEQLRLRSADLWSQLDASPQSHAQASEPVDVSVVLGLVSRYLEAELNNEAIAAYAAERPDRRLAFAGIDPTEPGPAARVEQARRMGFAGLTVSPSHQNFHPSNTHVMRLYEAAAALGMPVVVIQGTIDTPLSMLEYAQPFLFDEVARSYPELKLVITHCGHPWIEQTLVLAGKHPNLYAELGNLCTRPWQLYNVLLQAHTLGVTDRLLFGSVFPFNTPTTAIETIYSLNTLTHGTDLPSIPREKLRTIVERDTLKCLGLSVGAPPKPAGAAGQPAPDKAEPTESETSATEPTDSEQEKSS